MVCHTWGCCFFDRALFSGNVLEVTLFTHADVYAIRNWKVGLWLVGIVDPGFLLAPLAVTHGSKVRCNRCWTRLVEQRGTAGAGSEGAAVTGGAVTELWSLPVR